MKAMKSSFPMLMTLALGTLMTVQSFAAPVTNSEQVEKSSAKPDLSYLQLTPEQVRKRDRQLAPLYDFYHLWISESFFRISSVAVFW